MFSIVDSLTVDNVKLLKLLLTVHLTLYKKIIFGSTDCAITRAQQTGIEKLRNCPVDYIQ